ncbi:MAG: enoyl-CoA hydratase [Proteobacteria bacterium]|nr:enoyl-CoA hydratase [Pseudomonadota bacterium]
MRTDIRLNTERMISYVEDGIGWLIFNNPARHNALSLAMWQGIADAMTAHASNDDVRVVILRGAGGKAFVSGADISEFDAQRGSAEQKESYARIAGLGSKALAVFEKPLLGLIEGYCIGGGLATALATDIRFATPDSRFGIPAAKLGLGYEFDGLAKLARIVGPSNARDIMFSARFMDADEAKQMGLVNYIVERGEIEAATIAYAKRIAANAPLTIKAAKAAVNAWERGSRPTDVERVEKLVNECFDSDDYKEGRRAFRDKKTPEFSGR